MTPAANTCPKCGKPLPNYDVMKDYCMCKDDDGVLLYEGSVADDCLRQLGEIE